MPHRHFWRCGTRRPASVPGHTGRSLTFESVLHLTRRRQRHSGAFSRSHHPDLHQKSARDRTRLANDTPPLPYPLYARLLPRLACALNRPLFVHFVQAAQAPPVLPLPRKNTVSKIVQNCAFFCKKRTAIAAHFGFAKLTSCEAHNNLLAY